MEEQLSFCFEPIGPWKELPGHNALIRCMNNKQATATFRMSGFEQGVVYLDTRYLSWPARQVRLYIYEDGAEYHTFAKSYSSVIEAKAAFNKMLPTLNFKNYK